MELFLVRHGQTDHNILDKAGIAGNNAPLNETGIAQAKKAAEIIDSADIIYASPLDRAQQTAEIITNKTGAKIITEPRLKEFDMGDWANFPLEQTKELFVQNDAWSGGSNRYSFRVPNGESWQDVEVRVRAILKGLTEKHGDQKVVLVSHNQTIRAFLGILENKDFENWFGFPIDNGSVWQFEL